MARSDAPNPRKRASRRLAAILCAPRLRRGSAALVALAPLGAIAVIAACNSISGLDDFQLCNGPCTDDEPDARVDGHLPDVQVSDAATDGGTRDDGGPIPPIDVRRLWARWPLSPIADSGPAFEVEDGGDRVRDTRTALTWERGTGTASSLADAIARCKGLGGDMTLPSRIELASLLDFTRGAGAPLTAAVFPDEPGAFWVLGGWSLDFSTGAVKQKAKGGDHVRCVRLEDPRLGRP